MAKNLAFSDEGPINQIQLFIDNRPPCPAGPSGRGQEIDQLIDLVTANLVRIHMSEIAVREWRSQMVEEFHDAVKEMHKSLAWSNTSNFQST